MADRTTIAHAKFVLAVHTFELVQEAEVLDRLRSSLAKPRQPIVFVSKTVSLDDLRTEIDSERKALCPIAASRAKNSDFG
jgi:hypothetical protein